MPKGKLKRSNQHPAARVIRRAIGATDTESVEVMTPQFTRTSNMPPVQPPPGLPTEWQKLRAMTKAALKSLGCGSWDGRLMLFPGEWYSLIPSGLEIEDINGRQKKFVPGSTSNDIRFGFLAYGVPAVDGKEVEDE